MIKLRITIEKCAIKAVNRKHRYTDENPRFTTVNPSFERKFVVSRVKIDKPGNPFVNSLFRLHANCKLILQINVRRINTFIIPH